MYDKEDLKMKLEVLNLIINGIPSILHIKCKIIPTIYSFKPYYKWNTFNTVNNDFKEIIFRVLNLIINGIPSIPNTKFGFYVTPLNVF